MISAFAYIISCEAYHVGKYDQQSLIQTNRPLGNESNILEFNYLHLYPQLNILISFSNMNDTLVLLQRQASLLLPYINIIMKILPENRWFFLFHFVLQQPGNIQLYTQYGKKMFYMYINEALYSCKDYYCLHKLYPIKLVI